jgi:hypothetical protein
MCKFGAIVIGFLALRPVSLEVGSVAWANLPHNSELLKNMKDIVRVDRLIPRGIDIVYSKRERDFVFFGKVCGETEVVTITCM